MQHHKYQLSFYFNLYQGYLITAFLKFTTAVLSKHKRNYLFCPKATTFY